MAKALAATPKLMERPLAVVGDKAAVGRPLENILAILPKAGSDKAESVAAAAPAESKADEANSGASVGARGGKKAAPAAADAADKGTKSAKAADGAPVRRSPRTAAAQSK